MYRPTLGSLPMKRRHFLDRLIATTVIAAVANSVAQAKRNDRPPRILLRSSWQCVNIGDIAHTPGVLALLEKHLPEAEVILWASGNLRQTDNKKVPANP